MTGLYSLCNYLCSFLCCIYEAPERGQERVDPSREKKANCLVLCVFLPL